MAQSGSYRIYGLDGKDMASGVLSSAMTISPPIFDIVITFMLTADAMTCAPRARACFFVVYVCVFGGVCVCITRARAQWPAERVV